MERLFIPILVLVGLYCIYGIALFRMGRYMCLHVPALAFVPIVNLLYMCYISDNMMLMLHEQRINVTRFVAPAVLIIGVLAWITNAGVVTNIIWQVAAVTFVLTLSWAYVSILVTLYEHSLLVWTLSLLCLAPIVTLACSFRLPKVAEEVAELYSGQ